jgi:hypothetical protein
MAEWRMYSRKQIEKAADLAEQRRSSAPDPAPGPAPADPMPDELSTSFPTHAPKAH